MAGSEALDAFLGALPEAARPRFEGAEVREQLGALIERLHREGQAAYPDLTVGAQRFAGELARRLGEAASVETIERIHADHLRLAIATGDGDDGALRRVDAELLPEVDACAARMRALPEEAAEVRGHLRRIVFVDEPGRPAAIRAYSGRGTLGGYVRVMAVRELVRITDKGRREVGVDDEELERLSPLAHPELAYLRDHYRAEVDAALRDALTALAEQPRALLRYHVIDGWSIDRIGALYGVHRATAARWVTAAREELGDGIRTALALRLTISVDEVDSIVRLVQSTIDVSIARLLAPS